MALTNSPAQYSDRVDGRLDPPDSSAAHKILRMRAARMIAALAGLISASTAATSVALSDTAAPAGLGEYLVVPGVVTAVGVVVVIWLLRRVGRREESARFRSLELRAATLLMVGMFLVIVTSGAWYALSRIEGNVRDRASDLLTAVRDTTYQSFRIRVAEHMARVNRWARDPRLRQLTTHLADGAAEIWLRALQELGAMFQHAHLGLSEAEALVIGSDQTLIAPANDKAFARFTHFRTQYPERLRQLFRGDTVMFPPLDQHDRLVFFLAPIRAPDGRIIAALGLPANPDTEFSTITQTGRLGNSGESYIFNREGRMLTASRFAGQLRDIGLIGQGEADPGEGPGRAADRGVHADQAPARIEQRAAGVARVDRGVGLDHVPDRPSRGRLDLAPQRADHADRERLVQAEGVPQREDLLAHGEVGRVARDDRDEPVLRRLDP